MTSKALVPQSPALPHTIEADGSLPAVRYADVLRDLGMVGTPVPFASLVGRELRIERAKPFISSYNEADHAWYCVVTDIESGERLGVVIGGGACVEVLDAYAKAGRTEPLIVRPKENEGGRFGRYYTFE